MDGVDLGAPADGQPPELPKARPRLLTLTNDDTPTETPPGVTVQPAYEWMLENAGG